MSISALWDGFSLWIMHAGLPTVALYHAFCLSSFYNVAAEDATGLEKAANVCLSPVQYLFAGQVAIPVTSQEGSITGYHLEQRFTYEDPSMWRKTAVAYLVLPPAVLAGSILKGLSFFSSDTRSRRDRMSLSLSSLGFETVSNRGYYQSLGVDLVSFDEAEKISSQGYERRPGDADKLKAEKEALKEIVTLLNKEEIVYWLDCGTCLGAYRYGGNIPWDWDVDIAILQPDFDNVRHVLSALDPDKYVVQDWSSRDKPKTYLKVYVKETDSLIDIYHFAIDAEKKEIHSILSNGDCVFLPESWKIRENRFVMPTPFSFVFPLKKASFDGIEAYVPCQTEKYLQQRYGQNISPARVYDATTGQYEKDQAHPYWQELYTR